jgi:hypothetical protein
MKRTRDGLIVSSSLLMLVFFCVLSVSADIIEPGKTNVQVQYKVTNIECYPDYIFLVYTSPMISYSQIGLDEEIRGYKFTTACLYAIRISDYTNVTIGDSDEELQQFFENNPKLIQSNIRLTFLGKIVPDFDTLQTQTILLEIKSLTQLSLKIQISSIQYRSSDGTIEEVSYHGGDFSSAIIYPAYLPEPLDRSMIWMWYVLVPSCTLPGIIATLKIAKKRDDKR